MKAEQWKQLYNLFNPAKRLELEDRDLFVRRPGAVAQKIAADLNLGLEENGKWVVCGSTGSGKSSELVHLADELQKSRVVIGIDLSRSVAKVDDLQPAEVLFLIGAAAVQMPKTWGQEIDTAAVEQLKGAFRGLLKDRGHTINVSDLLQGVALLAVNAAAPGAAAVAGGVAGLARAAAGALGDKAQMEVKTPKMPTMLGGLTKGVREGEADLEALREAVDGVLAAVRNDRPPVVLVDGLDKIQDRGRIQDLFTGTRILTMPAAQVVYTGPITLMLSTDYALAGRSFRRERLTNVVIREPSFAWVHVTPEQVEEGRSAMREVVQRRVAALHLRVTDVFAPGTLDLLVEMSGGVLRELVHLANRAVRSALGAGAARIEEAHAEAAIVEIRKELEFALFTNVDNELAHVAKVGKPSGPSAADLLLANYILPYSNGDVWFEPHPILRGLRPNL